MPVEENKPLDYCSSPNQRKVAASLPSSMASSYTWQERALRNGWRGGASSVTGLVASLKLSVQACGLGMGCTEHQNLHRTTVSCSLLRYGTESSIASRIRLVVYSCRHRPSRVAVRKTIAGLLLAAVKISVLGGRIHVCRCTYP